MSKSKLRQTTDICADCGAAEPTWASINRGILLCVECCNTHRSLGRHISVVKSLKSIWIPNQLAMVHALNNAGVNTLWEQLLEKDAKLAKRKPSASDSLEDKAKFIRSKHQNNEFLIRPNKEDGFVCIENELGKQLHASVRANNLLTSLRFLIQGADPNYFHDEKGSTPLHAAVKANQALQIELLLIYGADPTYPDSLGKTPIDYAKQSINKTIANRLTEAQYEVTDKFSHYLCHRKPDHQNGIDFLIPNVATKCTLSAIDKMKRLSNDVFEELVKDVYDEVDRRETEAIWLGSSDTIELCAVPFLPVDPSLSTTRNQSRQKLARFASPELKALVHDILVDAQRRQKLAENGLRQISQISDDDPLYDSVASDDDYSIVSPEHDKSDDQMDQNQNAISNEKEKEKYELLNKQLADSSSTISDLKNEVSNLKALVEHLSSVNHDLRSRLSQFEGNAINGNRNYVNSDSGSQSLDGYLLSRKDDQQFLTNGRVNDNNNSDASKKAQRPSSMYETREGLRIPNWQTIKHQIKQNEQNRSIPQSLNVMQCTEQVTKGISDLWKCIQGPGRENCILYADKIQFAVKNLAKAVPVENGTETVKHLLESASHLQTNCIGLQNASKLGESALSDKYIQKVRSWAYEIARDTKSLVTKYNTQT